MSDQPRGEQGPEDAHAAALNAVVRFTEAANLVHDSAALGRLAQQLLDHLLPTVEVGYYELEHDLLKVRAFSPTVPTAVTAVLEAGVSRQALPQLWQPFDEACALFIEYDASLTQVPETGAYQTTALAPLWRRGEPFGVLGLGLRELRPFELREKLVLLSVGHALQLALDRAWHAQDREARLHELERRGHALEAFAELGRDLALGGDPGALIHQAGRLLFTLLPGSSVQFWEERGDGWQVTSRVGPPAREEWWDLLPSPAQGPAAILTAPRQQTGQQPVRVDGEVRGVLEVTLRGGPGWTPADRAVLETVAYHLSIALERAGQVRDLTARHQALEDQVQEARAARRASEAFSEATLRDLRREVAGLETGGEPGERAGALRHRLDGLLEYAELARRPLRVGLVSLLQLTLALREEWGDEPSVHWHLGELPVVRGDQDLLRRVLREVLSNAVKFSRGRPPAHIEVWSEAHPEGRAVYVRDNGVGFEPEFAEFLFGPEGQGQAGGRMERDMGLAVVRRIVERHGGRVWAEGQPGGGATFGFTLP